MKKNAEVKLPQSLEAKLRRDALLLYGQPEGSQHPVYSIPFERKKRRGTR